MATETADKDIDRSQQILDPHSAWLLMVDALSSGHWRVVRGQAEDLLDWMKIGESPPNICNGKMTDRQWNRQVAVYACRLARLIARRRLRG
jgi:hypothetical protein